MLIRCEKCGTSYELDPNVLPRGGAPVQCTRCSNVFTAVPPVPGATAPAQAAPVRQAAGAATVGGPTPGLPATAAGASGTERTLQFGSVAVEPEGARQQASVARTLQFAAVRPPMSSGGALVTRFPSAAVPAGGTTPSASPTAEASLPAPSSLPAGAAPGVPGEPRPAQPATIVPIPAKPAATSTPRPAAPPSSGVQIFGKVESDSGRGLRLVLLVAVLAALVGIAWAMWG